MTCVPASLRFAVDGLWSGRAFGPAVLEQSGSTLRVVTGTTARREPTTRLRGTLLPGVVDRHVHLGLVDGARLAQSAVVEVHDLGWIPEVARDWKRAPHTGGPIRIAGPFLTAPGGYPLEHAWAPDTAVRQLADPRAATAAVDEAAAYGHDLVKVALVSGQGRLDDPTLEAIVTAAHAHGLPVGVHAQGPGQAERAFVAGADVLVHTPWTDVLPDETIARMAASMTWISTLTIHGGVARRRAAHNALAFLRHGGRLVYGTDMGNGATPVGVHPREVRALAALASGVDDLLRMLTGVPDTGPDPAQVAIPVSRAIVAAGPVPRGRTRLASWLATAGRFDPLSPTGGAR